MKTAEAATEFLGCRRFAVTGVSREPANHGSNVVYKRLRERGYDVVAINPNAETVEGDRCYATLAEVPDEIDVVVIGTGPERAVDTMKECIDRGITKVWMHRAFGAGSASPDATALGRKHGITVIDGGCPCMFEPTADFGHKVMRAVFTLSGNVPRRV